MAAGKDHHGVGAGATDSVRTAVRQQVFSEALPCFAHGLKRASIAAMDAKNFGSPLQNRLIAALPRDDFEQLLPHFKTEAMAQGMVLAQPGDEYHEIYFPFRE